MPVTKHEIDLFTAGVIYGGLCALLGIGLGLFVGGVL